MSKPADIVAIALAEVGYREKATNSMLDDKTANSGSNNWTKYARDLAAAGYYNGNKNGYAWCDVFVDWCFFKAYGAVEGQRIQCQSGPLGAGCIYSAQYYQQKDRYDRKPKVGDQVFFQTGGQIGHTGIVVEVTDTTITTVEGNSSDQVKKNTYSRSNGYIAGYGHPLYSDTPAAATENRYAAMRLWLDEFKEHTESGDFMNDADGSIMKALVEKIIVKDASMEICFKCGVSIEQVYIE